MGQSRFVFERERRKRRLADTKKATPACAREESLEENDEGGRRVMAADPGNGAVRTCDSGIREDRPYTAYMEGASATVTLSRRGLYQLKRHPKSFANKFLAPPRWRLVLFVAAASGCGS